MSEIAAPTPRRYSMFISYRHADNLEMGRKWASWLHESVEAYEIPADLTGRSNQRGEPVPASLYPVFRDEEELPADADLSNNLQRALQHSGLLVVICSPRAVASRFVADEIRHFKELGKGDRILALIVDGEPNASDTPGPGAASECFPDPLRFGVAKAGGEIDWSARTEPIAADCRPGGRPEQGWTTPAAYAAALELAGVPKAARLEEVKDYAARLELAKLKVIAGALGVPLGELTRRDQVRQLQRAKRRARILTGLSSGFGVLAAIAVALGWMANERRKEANVQRQQAVAARGLADERRVEAEDQRQQAVAAKGQAETARNQAEAERRQAVATLAQSDFQEGVNRLADETTARDGLAFLARSAGAGHESAASRIWTVFQSQPFWLPQAASGEAPPPFPRHLAESPARAGFESVKFRGRDFEPSWYAESADGRRGVAVLNLGDPGEDDRAITFRFRDTATGREIGAWHELKYEGDFYLSGIRAAALSADGKFAAIVASPWRRSEYLEVWDVDRGVKIGEAVTADGAVPNEQGGTFSDLWFVEPGEGGEGLWLVSLSDRGNAAVHHIDTDPDAAGMAPLALHGHAQGVVGAVVDRERGIFASAAQDRSIRISKLTGEGPAAWPVTASAGVAGLRIDAADRLGALLEDGTSAAWRFAAPRRFPAPAQRELAANTLDGLLKSWPEDGQQQAAPPPPAQRETLELRVDGQEVTLADTAADGAVKWKRRFGAPVAFARFLDAGRVSIQTANFTTEIWDTAKDVRLHPVIDEARQFTADAAADTVLLSALSPDGRMLLTRSFRWDPPNVGVFGFTVWDVASGKPLTTRRVGYENIATDEVPVTHAEFSRDGAALLFGQAGKEAPKAVTDWLELVPPGPMKPRVAALGEALAGQRLQADGNLTPVPPEALRVVDELGPR